jgi:photosystem II stability/assembly factor-like uncharacterized protein
MATDQIKLRPYNKKILPFDQLKANLIDYLTGADEANMQMLFGNDTVIVNAIPVTATGNNHVHVGATGGPFSASNGLGKTVKFNAADSRLQTIAIPPDAGQVYDIGLEVALVEQGLETNPRTGDVQYQTVKEDIGRIGTPDTVTVSGGGLVIALNGLLGTQNHAGRQVKVWLKPKEDGGNVGPKSLSSAIAFETLTVAFVGGNNQVTTAAQFGQTGASTTPGDYKVQVIGPTVRKESVENLRNTAGCVFLGAVTSVASGSPIVAISVVDQNVAPYTLANVAPPLRAISRNLETPAGNIKGIAYDGSSHIVAATDGRAIHSFDGIWWEAVLSGPSANVNAIAYGGGKFVMVGQSGLIYTSSDGGINWTSHTTGTAHLLAVAYGATHFVAVGAGGTILSSPDGATWTAQTAPETADDITTIAYGGGVFLVGTSAGGSTNGGRVHKSADDGLTWTAATTPGFTDNNGNYSTCLAYGNGMFVVTHDAENLLTGGQPFLYYSTNAGTTWTQVSFAPQTLSNSGNMQWTTAACAFVNGQFVLVFKRGQYQAYAGYMTADAQNFTPLRLPRPRSAEYSAIAFVGGNYYIGRADGNILQQSFVV